MSWFSDNLDFELFNLGDMWDRIKDDPKRLLLGVDPLSTGMWNTVLGRDDDAIVNQLGGPMGSGGLGLGESGGVYGRAEEAGIDTGAAGGMHDIAEVVASIWGGYGAAQGLGAAWGSMGGSEGIAGIMPGEWGGGSGGAGGGFDWQSMMQMGGGMPGMGGQQQQQQTPPPRASLPVSQSSFDSAPMGMPEPYMPTRPRPFGLLDEESEKEKMRAFMGGLL